MALRSGNDVGNCPFLSGIDPTLFTATLHIEHNNIGIPALTLMGGDNVGGIVNGKTFASP